MTRSTICRLCASACNDFQSLYYTNGRPNGIYEIMLELFHPKFVDMEAAKHLTSICLDCFRHIYDFHSFQTSVMMAQLELVDDLAKMNVNGTEENEETSKDGDVNSDEEDGEVERKNGESSEEDDVNSTIIEQGSIRLSDEEDGEVERKNDENEKISEKDDVNYTVVEQSSILLSDEAEVELSRDDIDDSFEMNLNKILALDGQNNDGNISNYSESGNTMLIETAEHLFSVSEVEDVSQAFSCKCTLCGSSFQSKRSLSFHMRLRHWKKAENTNQTDVTRLKCKFCGYFYRTIYTLRAHIQTQHPGYEDTPKYHKCKLCGKYYGHYFHLENHMKLHANDKIKQEEQESDIANDAATLPEGEHEETMDLPNQCVNKDFATTFKCNFCDNSFKSIATWRKHCKDSHSVYKPLLTCSDYDITINRYKCHICYKTFVRYANLVYHKKSIHEGHRQFRCDTCGIFFFFRRALKMHLTREHPGKTITASSSDSRLEKRHPDTGRKGENPNKLDPFKCDICGHTYKHERTFRKHIELRHGAN